MATPGLEALRGAAVDPQMLEDALFQRSKLDIDQQKNEYLRQQEEAAAGRGMTRGLGIADYVTSLRTDAESKFSQALERARLDAYTASQKARLSALSDVASKEAAHRGMDISQATGRRAAKGQERGQWMQAGAGIGQAGIGTIGRVFGEDIKSGAKKGAGGLADLLGGGGGPEQVAGPGSGYTPPGAGGPEMPGMPDLSGIRPAESDFDFSGMDMPSFQSPDMSFDLSSLFGGPQAADYMDWLDLSSLFNE